LQSLGFHVNVLFGPDSLGVVEWQSIPAANFNILVSPWYGLPIVEHLAEKYDQPFFHFAYPPIGANETTRFLTQLANFAQSIGVALPDERLASIIAHEENAFYEEIDNLATFLLEFRYGLPNHVHILHDAGYVIGLARFLLHEVGIVPKEQYILDNTPPEFQEQLRDILAATSDKREIPVTFDPDAGAAQRALRDIYGYNSSQDRSKIVAAGRFGAGAELDSHAGRGLIIGSGWDKELARDLDCDYLPAAAPCPYRLVLTSNYVGYSGGLRVIEDIYDIVLATYA
jgi:nitrogenase molybdenum-iron protein beta chain